MNDKILRNNKHIFNLIFRFWEWMDKKRILLSNVVKFIISFSFSFLDSLCILCLKDIIWAMATFFAIFWAMGKLFGPWDFFRGPWPEKWPWAKKILPMGKW